MLIDGPGFAGASQAQPWGRSGGRFDGLLLDVFVYGGGGKLLELFARELGAAAACMICSCT